MAFRAEREEVGTNQRLRADIEGGREPTTNPPIKLRLLILDRGEIVRLPFCRLENMALMGGAVPPDGFRTFDPDAPPETDD